MKLVRYLLIVLTAVAMMAAPQAKKSAPAKGAATKAAPAAAAAKTPLLDINSASEQDLKALPGIGDAYSAKIIAGRPRARRNSIADVNDSLTRGELSHNLWRIVLS